MDKTTCIIVGAGPAGSACAYSLAKKGIESVTLERARVPGEKNVASFVLFTSVLKHLIPNFMDDIPLERNVIRRDHVILGEKDVNMMTSYNYRFIDDPVVFTAFRSKYDAWLAQKATDAGAEIIPEQTVTDLIIDKGRVIGVKVGDDELYADVVVGADGYHSKVAEKAGLIKEWAPERCWLGVKEVLNLPSEVINERFQISDGLGCEIGVSTYKTNQLTAFEPTIYTNTDSVSLAVFGRLGEIKQQNVKLHDYLDTFKEHPYVHNLLKGATLREYQAHIISDGGRVKPKNLFGDGVLLCGEAGAIMDRFGVGVPTCMLSGMMAAETIEDAIKKGDFSSRTMKNYLKYLDSTALLSMINESSKNSDYYAGNGPKEMSDEMEAGANTVNKWMDIPYNYISKESYPLLLNLFLSIGQYNLPRLIRWPIYVLIKTFALYRSVHEKIKRKTRRRYYEWKT